MMLLVAGAKRQVNVWVDPHMLNEFDRIVDRIAERINVPLSRAAGLRLAMRALIDEERGDSQCTESDGP